MGNYIFNVGIMQGRLSQKPNLPLQSFPLGTWKDEFYRAKKIGFDKIEWLVDKEFDYQNPIFSEDGRDKIINLSNIYRIKVETLCAHFFMKGTILKECREGELIKNYFFKLIRLASNIGVNYISIPLMGNMSLKRIEVNRKLEKIFSEIIPDLKINILLETDISNINTFSFIKKLDSPKIGMLYDLGNATKLKFALKDEFPEVQKYVKEIHIKDYSLNLNKSVRLGDGDTNFEQFIELITKYNWRGPIILETPIFDNWEQEARENYKFSIKKLNKNFN